MKFTSADCTKLYDGEIEDFCKYLIKNKNKIKWAFIALPAYLGSSTMRVGEID